MKPIEEQELHIKDLSITHFKHKSHDGSDSLWIRRNEINPYVCGEGMQVSVDKFYEFLNKFYEENF